VSGVSHSPEELTAPEDMVNGANVLVNAVLALGTGRTRFQIPHLTLPAIANDSEP
jgi:hypothetical protein